MHNWILFDWGDTLMRTLDFPGPMCTWPRLETVPGALELLSAVHGRAGIALATNAADSQEPEIREALGRAGLAPFVERIFCFRTVGHRKSSPPFFAHVGQSLGLPPHRLLMVGDDFEQDVLAANAVGIKAVWFNEKGEEAKTGVDFHTIHRLGELPFLLERWGFLEPERRGPGNERAIFQ